MKADDGDFLRAEITELIAAALATDEGHVAEMDRRDDLHIAETGRRDVLHHGEIQRRQDGFEHEMLTIREALETRDLIGQAKGIIMGSMGCSAEEAFLLLKKQSQGREPQTHRNRHQHRFEDSAPTLNAP